MLVGDHSRERRRIKRSLRVFPGLLADSYCAYKSRRTRQSVEAVARSHGRRNSRDPCQYLLRSCRTEIIEPRSDAASVEDARSFFLRPPSPVTSARPELSHEPRAAEVSWLPGLGSVAVTRAERQRAAPKASDPEDALAPYFVYAAAWRCAKWPFYISSSLGHASCRTTGGGQMAAVVRLPCRPGGSCAEMSAPRSDRPSNLSVQ